ncbi:MAG: hypothetical protein D6711_03305 [Chloroflexi bacterium]|nr:MAG: hypothetical protein D6711_03305 [Chloroflexota bacterium]
MAAPKKKLVATYLTEQEIEHLDDFINANMPGISRARLLRNLVLALMDNKLTINNEESDNEQQP